MSGYIGAGNLSLTALNYKKAQLMAMLMMLIKLKITHSSFSILLFDKERQQFDPYQKDIYIHVSLKNFSATTYT